MLNIEYNFDYLPWLKPYQDQLDALIEADRLPHALLIQALPGMGRRQLAMWLATRVLGADPTAAISVGRDEEESGHPDFYPIELQPTDSNPNKLKTVITIDQIRDLIVELSLTSFGPGGKVAVIYPADKLNVNAANSLLKTLEEPPGKTMIILVCESPRRLPATIISRCQTLKLAAPDTDSALQWLEAQAPGTRFANLLDFAGGAPLQALKLHAAEFAEQANAYAADLKKLEQRAISPVVVAERWKKSPELALEWLYWRLARRVRMTLEALSGKAPEGTGTSPERLQHALQACFRQMSQIRELRRVISGGISAELNLAGLLMDWYGGLGADA